MNASNGYGKRVSQEGRMDSQSYKRVSSHQNQTVILSISHRPVKLREDRKFGGKYLYFWTTRTFPIALSRMERKAQFRNKAVSKESMVTIRKNTIVLSIGTRKLSDQSLINLYHTPEGNRFPIGML
jgi:hypothetical protein